MLYEDFNAKRRMDGEDVFTSRVNNEIVQNLNPKFELREYQKEALGRFDFTCLRRKAKRRGRQVF